MSTEFPHTGGGYSSSARRRYLNQRAEFSGRRKSGESTSWAFWISRMEIDQGLVEK
jgi:hypothetical protein